MIRRKIRLPSRADSIATAFADDLRARYGPRDPAVWGAMLRPAKQIERGEPVVVSDLRLRRFGVRPGPSRHVELGPDGEVTYVEPIRDGVHIMEWRRVT